MTSGWWKSTATITCEPTRTRQTSRRRATSTTRCGLGPLRCGHTTRSLILVAGERSWSTATASSATCAFTCSTWCAGCSTSAGRSVFPRREASSFSTTARRTSRIRKRRPSNSKTSRSCGRIAPTATRRIPEYPWGAPIYGDKGTLKVDVHKFDYTPRGQGNPIHEDRVMELDEYPEDRTEERLERHVAPAIRRHMLDFLAAIDQRSRARGRH